MKNIFIAMMALAIGFSASAQKNKRPDARAGNKQHKEYHKPGEHKMKGAHFAKDLNLTDEQRTRIKSMNEEFRAEMKALNADKKLAAEQLKDRRKALIKEHSDDLSTVLTPEQRLQLENKKKERKEKDWTKKEGKAAPGRLDKLDKQLNLTDNQGQKIKEINQEFRTKVQEIRKDESLTNDQKKEQMMVLQRRHTEDIKSLLTDEQIKKLEEMKKNRAGRSK